ncbi:ABC transporter ATP-binding protein [Paenibacillus sp. IB182496]|uniref:ABC transporter ATP-binding protein n=1 Tax=Paenibacillus sabuli TaxID=2772509 RepID=A0A927BTJ7_9BACL|nr:ABC transporter ATP-binding protein [Paenibacillus sabuli]MBD2845510.1 ABC transporter ATP-binding protein [Paenibacillus sabuli]
MTLLIKTNNICKKYNSNINQFQLKPTSISFEKGKIYIIKGRSGSGKSTLLNIIGGIDRPTSGTVFFNNESFYDLSDNKQSEIRNKNFGFVFQSFNLIPELTAKDNISLPKHFNKNININDNKINRIAEELGIKHLLNSKPFQLSGGEQQRIAIARALITTPEIIFADEPTGNLDNLNSQNVAKLLIDLVSNRNVTLILVTHEENLIKHQHTKFFMHDGELKLEEGEDDA